MADSSSTSSTSSSTNAMGTPDAAPPRCNPEGGEDISEHEQGDEGFDFPKSMLEAMQAAAAGGGYGDFDDDGPLMDPLQQFGGLFVTQNEQSGHNETITDILADIRNALNKGVKILYNAYKK